jgi:hypothetical protein
LHRNYVATNFVTAYAQGTIAKRARAAIAILVKTTYQSDRSLQKPGYPEVSHPIIRRSLPSQKLHQAIALLAKTTQAIAFAKALLN